MEMGNFKNLGALLAVYCIFMSVHYATSAPAPAAAMVKITILHSESGRLVRGTPSQEHVTADGGEGGQYDTSYH